MLTSARSDAVTRLICSICPAFLWQCTIGSITCCHNSSGVACSQRPLNLSAVNLQGVSSHSLHHVSSEMFVEGRTLTCNANRVAQLLAQPTRCSHPFRSRTAHVRERRHQCLVTKAESPEGGSSEQQEDDAGESPASVKQQVEQQQQQRQRKRRGAGSTDASASTLTRRFGLAGGLAWLGFLTFGVVSEQVLLPLLTPSSPPCT